MISLAVKYRPKTWSSLTEQDSVKVILQNQLETNTTKNAYLFVGGAGTGKTTSARIFANEINKGLGNPIELDAASNNGVDDVRGIIQQAQTKSLDSEYKIFIIDECFSSNTLVKTDISEKPISEICVGDVVESMSGNKIVTHIFKNRVLTDRLCCVSVNNRKIITTVEHLFFTNKGWIEASQLRKGDIVYDSESLRELWQRVYKEEGPRREILFKQLCNNISIQEHDNRGASENSEGNSNLSDMSTKVCSEKDLFSKDLFLRVQKSTYYEVEQTVDEYKIWDGTSETIIRKNVKRQSNERPQYNSKDVEHERAERHITSMAYSAGWERKIYDSTDRLVESIRRWLGIRISDKHEEPELERNEITLVLQSRPWLFKEKTGDRGRWSRPQMEKFIIEGCEKNRSFGNVRVESVEIYKRGYNDELFRSSFSNSELSSGYVTMYDLEVDGDHSYFVENTLVHNCHAISSAGWQAFLKLIEEPPAKSIFIFCTTNPEKIPKTILSRVQRYDFKRISQQGIVDRLAYILCQEFEKPDAWKEAIEYIARIADGGMRDAITLLDKCLAYSTELTLENVVKALGTVDYEVMFKLTDMLISNKTLEAMSIVDDINNAGKDLKQFVHSYCGFLLDLCRLDIGVSWDNVSLPKLEDYEKKVNSYRGSTNLRSWLKYMIALDTDIKYSATPKMDIQAIIYINTVE